MTAMKSASIDSLAASIQCASSMMTSVGSRWARAAPLTSAVNRLRLRIGSDIGRGGCGITDAEQIVDES